MPILDRKQVTCFYDRHYRELGWTVDVFNPDTVECGAKAALASQAD